MFLRGYFRSFGIRRPQITLSSLGGSKVFSFPNQRENGEQGRAPEIVESLYSAATVRVEKTGEEGKAKQCSLNFSGPSRLSC